MGYLEAAGLEPEAKQLSKIRHVWGDAVTMRERGGSHALIYESGHFDLVIYGLAIPEGIVPRQLLDSLNDGGVLVGPQCNNASRSHTFGAAYCTGQWRMYQRR